jgi:hypothetical protein
LVPLLHQLVGLALDSTQTEIQLAAYPFTLAGRHVDFLQGDHIRFNLDKLFDQQVAPLSPAIGTIVGVNRRYRNFCGHTP